MPGARWPHKHDKHVPCADMRKSIQYNDLPRGQFQSNKKNPHNAEVIPMLLVADVAECWPDCDDE